MKRTQKGFTLVELLAVIVILAVILIIAVPQISGLISGAKQDADETSMKMIVKAAETAIATGNMAVGISADTDYSCTDIDTASGLKVNAKDSVNNADLTLGTATSCGVTVDSSLTITKVYYGAGTTINGVAPSAIDAIY